MLGEIWKWRFVESLSITYADSKNLEKQIPPNLSLSYCKIRECNLNTEHHLYRIVSANWKGFMNADPSVSCRRQGITCTNTSVRGGSSVRFEDRGAQSKDFSYLFSRRHFSVSHQHVYAFQHTHTSHPDTITNVSDHFSYKHHFFYRRRHFGALRQHLYAFPHMLLTLAYSKNSAINSLTGAGTSEPLDNKALEDMHSFISAICCNCCLLHQQVSAVDLRSQHSRLHIQPKASL